MSYQQPCYQFPQGAPFMSPSGYPFNYNPFYPGPQTQNQPEMNPNIFASSATYAPADVGNMSESFMNAASLMPLIQQQQQPMMNNQLMNFGTTNAPLNVQNGTQMANFPYFQQLDPTSLTLCKAIEKTSKMLQYAKEKEIPANRPLKKRRECNKSHTTLKISNFSIPPNSILTEEWVINNMLPSSIQPICVRLPQNENIIFIEFASMEDCQNSAVFVKSHFPNSNIEFEMSTEKDLTNVYITNLPSTDDYNKECLEKMFSQFGQVQSCKLIDLNHNSGRIGFVRFQRRSEASFAIQEIKRRQIILSPEGKSIECKYANKNARNSSSSSIILNSPVGGGGQGGISVNVNGPVMNEAELNNLPQSSPILVNNTGPNFVQANDGLVPPGWFQPDINNNIARYIFQNVQ